MSRYVGLCRLMFGYVPLCRVMLHYVAALKGTSSTFRRMFRYVALCRYTETTLKGGSTSDMFSGIFDFNTLLQKNCTF